MKGEHWNPSKLIGITFFSVCLLVAALKPSQSSTMEEREKRLEERILKEIQEFDQFFKKVIFNYASSSYYSYRKSKYIKSNSFLASKNGKTIEFDDSTMVEELTNSVPMLSDFYKKMKDSNMTYLEALYAVSLPDLAEELCVKIGRVRGDLPKEYEILRKIHKGENFEVDIKKFSPDLIHLFYRVSNDAGNIEMVNKFKDGKEQEAIKLKELHPEAYSRDVNYIHEPYWSYNIVQLREYAERIIKKIRPYFVEEKSILVNEKGTFVVLPNREEIRVRQVSFQYVLPNLYLKERLKEDPNRSVPRIWILPKHENIEFTFKMPYSDKPGFILLPFKKKHFASSFPFNPLQVLSDDVTVYQEFIDGKEEFGDRSFFDLGHSDFNRVQIITSNKDHKKYLIDTKESKNFFTELTSTYADIVYDAKALNFTPGTEYVNISVRL